MRAYHGVWLVGGFAGPDAYVRRLDLPRASLAGDDLEPSDLDVLDTIDCDILAAIVIILMFSTFNEHGHGI